MLCENWKLDRLSKSNRGERLENSQFASAQALAVMKKHQAAGRMTQEKKHTRNTWSALFCLLLLNASEAALQRENLNVF